MQLIRGRNPKKQLNIIRYRQFKDLSKLTPTYETETDLMDKRGIIRDQICISRRKAYSNEDQLTYNRKRSRKFQSDYWRGGHALEDCNNNGRGGGGGGGFLTEDDLGKHRRFHCGGEDTEFRHKRKEERWAAEQWQDSGYQKWIICYLAGKKYSVTDEKNGNARYSA